MSILLRSLRLTKIPLPAEITAIPHKWRALSSISHLIKMSATSAYQASYEGDGDAAEGPKQLSQLRHLELNDGNKIPMLGYGLGTARYKDDPSAPLDKELIKTVVMAIKAGYYHLDGAQVYNNETELGIAIKESGVPREKLYVTTKISGTKVQDTQEAFKLSLEKLQLDYVDQYLIHAPFFAEGSKAALQEKWADLEAIHATGKAKSIGVSNFLQSDVEALLETAKIKPAINQIEYHPYLQHGTLVDFHKENGIALSAYAPLTAVVKAKPGPLDQTYQVLAKRYGVTPGEIALRWVIDQGIVALTTSQSEDRLRDYQKVASFKLTPGEMEDITVLGRQKHYRGFWRAKFADDDRS